MPSKTSKKRQPQPSRWKSEQGCAEERVLKIAREFAAMLQPGDRVFLEGEMGTGKTTFARALLSGLGVVQPPEGSPSFAIAHEYDSPRGNVVHIDFYRLKHDSEIEDAGIDAYFFERQSIVISEWIGLFPNFEGAVREAAKREYSLNRIWEVRLAFSRGDPSARDLDISL